MAGTGVAALQSAQGRAIGGYELQEGGAIRSCDLRRCSFQHAWQGEEAQLPLARIPKNATSISVLGCLNTPSPSFFQRFPFQLDFCFRFRGFGNFCGMKYLFF